MRADLPVVPEGLTAELLAVLKDVLDAYVSDWNEDRASDDSSLKRARALIRKATGAQ